MTLLALARTLQFIRFSHTVFALPFALGSMLVAAHGLPSWRIVALILLAMVFARTAAMAFNRLADWQIDKRNPRTAARHKLVSWPAAAVLCTGCAAGFVATTALINRPCLYLSPIALFLVFFYSLTKRFTALCHFFLGIALAVSPIGAWLAVTGRLDLPPFILAAGVVFWVAGFDLIYATQDAEFDKQEGRAPRNSADVAGGARAACGHVLAVGGVWRCGGVARGLFWKFGACTGGAGLRTPGCPAAGYRGCERGVFHQQRVGGGGVCGGDFRGPVAVLTRTDTD